MKHSVDGQLRDQQAGFRKDRSCTDQIATLRITVEQSVEWNSSLYINFIDYEKVFDSVDKTTLCKLFRHYGVHQKIVNIIQNSYDGVNCKVVHGRQVTDSFEVKTANRQGCLLSPLLFILVIDWIMKTSTSEGKHGTQWTFRMQLDDLDFAYIQVKNIWNSKQLSVDQHQGQDFQYKYQNSSTMRQNLGELRKPSSRRYRCLLTVVYAKYFGSVDRTLLATTYCRREQTRFQRRKKWGRSVGSG
ncbi:unnamed protein product [Schistosoma margrebowiei]|uniref:Reverse transcriptase domain-containing protein n=1 Tax=Schistosoma margrebowiei TaxID=48269 RepID=A0A183LQL8_9TREM|nr:unnamed protein product [Schistosoma margrebowiei]